ncbi:restriction endonuclease subunit S [Pelistega ratti]|nr:restriction endonuclease subunit S [Pelistega ratti]
MKTQLLKSTILQLAVQRKFIPQNPNDVPTSILPEKIQIEKLN